EAERLAVEFHARHARDAEDVWVAGLNLFLRSTDVYLGYRPQHPREMIMVGLFIAAWNSLYCAHDLGPRFGVARTLPAVPELVASTARVLDDLRVPSDLSAQRGRVHGRAQARTELKEVSSGGKAPMASDTV